MTSSFDLRDATEALIASDERWESPSRFSRNESSEESLLVLFARALAFTVDEPPRWVETVVLEGLDLVDAELIEARALTTSFLFVVTAPVGQAGYQVQPAVLIRSLTTLLTLEVDGFQIDAGEVGGCTIRLTFEGGYTTRLGASAAAGRGALAALLPSLQDALHR